MTDFETWMEEQASRQDTDGSLRMFRDLADLTAQLYDAASPFGRSRTRQPTHEWGSRSR